MKKNKEVKKEASEPKIMFLFMSRRQADCEETYQWLLTKDKIIAKQFRKKCKGAERHWLKRTL